jgi:hypothetical protein
MTSGNIRHWGQEIDSNEFLKLSTSGGLKMENLSKKEKLKFEKATIKDLLTPIPHTRVGITNKLREKLNNKLLNK